MNQIVITGRLVRDPEMKTLNNGTEKCRFTVAVDRRKKKDQPAKADFFDCDAWSGTGAFVNTWFKKGSAITVRGRMESSQGEKDGVKRTYWAINVEEVEFQMGQKAGAAPEEAPAIDEQSGMEQVNPEELPF